MDKWEKLSTEVINDNPWTSFLKDRFRLPNGKEGDYYYLHTDGCVLAIPVQDDGKIIMARQYRYLFDRESLEFPSGGVNKGGQTVDEALEAELAEEAGVKAGHKELIHKFSSANGVYDEYVHAYLVWGLEKDIRESDETEEFELVYLTFDEVEELMTNGEIWDSFSLAAWMVARDRVKELIDQLKKKQ